jgi:hypothetical protein
MIQRLEEFAGVRGALVAPGEEAIDPFRRAARGMLARGVAGGDLATIRQIVGALPAGALRRRVAESALPEALQEQERLNEQDQKFQDDLEERNKQRTRQRRDDRLKEEKRLRDEETAGRKALADTEKAEADALQRVREGIQLGRRVGREALRPERPAREFRPREFRPFAELPEHQAMQALAENQATQAENLRALAEINREIQRARRRNRTTVEFLNQPQMNQGK